MSGGAVLLVNDIVESVECMPPGAPGLQVYARFSKCPELLAIAVVEDGWPVGLINRARFFVRFGDTFGRAVYEKRPASLVMEPNPLIVDASMAVSDLRNLPLNSDNAALLEGFIVVRDGQFAGVSSVLSLYRAMQEKNSELEELLRVVDESRRLAQDADAAKSRFLAAVTHELRTPLNGILGYAGLIEEELDPSQTHLLKDIGSIRKAATHLAALINDVIDYATMDAGKMRMNLESFDANEWLQTSIGMIDVLAGANNNKLKVEIAPGLGEIVSDPMRLRQCLLNLVGNACKFTTDGEVTIRLFKQSDAPSTIMLEVSDTGIGMSADQMEKLFKPFTQADASVTRRFGGTGLGLAITRRIARQLGGDVDVVSALGAGSTFTLWTKFAAAAKASGALRAVA